MPESTETDLQVAREAARAAGPKPAADPDSRPVFWLSPSGARRPTARQVTEPSPAEARVAEDAERRAMLASIGVGVEPNQPDDGILDVYGGDPAPLFAALARAQGAFGPIPRTKLVSVRIKPEKGGGQYTYTYAPLEAVIEACRPALAANGLAYFERIFEVRAGRMLVAMLTHETGAYIKSRLLIPSGGDTKEFGGQVTYLRRFQRQAMMGVSPEDDADAPEEGDTIFERGDVRTARHADPAPPRPTASHQQRAAVAQVAAGEARTLAADAAPAVDDRRSACEHDLHQYAAVLDMATLQSEVSKASGASGLMSRWMDPNAGGVGIGFPDVADIVARGKAMHAAAWKRCRK